MDMCLELKLSEYGGWYVDWKFRSRNFSSSICKIYEELGKVEVIFGTYVGRRVEWYRSCEILEFFWAAPPRVSPEKTTRAVAPASACVRVWWRVIPCVLWRGRTIGGGLSDQATRVFECWVCMLTQLIKRSVSSFKHGPLILIARHILWLMYFLSFIQINWFPSISIVLSNHFGHFVKFIKNAKMVQMSPNFFS